MGEGSVLVRAFAAFVALALVTAPSAQAETRKPAQQLLDSLPVSTEVSAGYDRGLFKHWIRQSNGCNTRADVLIDERKRGTVVGCNVVNGAWTSFYDGLAVVNPRSLDIDHMVPLKEAWDSGAWRWDSATRTSFANDLGYPWSLIAVSASSNRSKGDRDPAQWLPSRNRCAYVKAWVGVKYRWRLSVDSAEKRALTSQLARCPGSMLVPPLASRTDDPDAGRPAPTNPNPEASGSGGLDPRFDTCAAAKAAGFGPYQRGVDPEYDWYIDRDGDGVACER